MFELNVWNDVYAPDFITESIDPYQIILEETEKAGGVKKNNVFQTVWAIIKRIIAVIRLKVAQIYQSIKSIFVHRQPDDKTLDQIAEHVLGETEEPSTKHLQFRYDDDKQIRINYLTNTIGKFAKDTKIPGKEKTDRPESHGILLAFHVIKKPYLLDPIIEMLQSIKDNNGAIDFDIKRAKNAVDTILAASTFGFTISIRLEEWSVFNEKIQKLGEVATSIDDHLTGRVPITIKGKEIDQEWLNVINEFGRVHSGFQIGLNLIGDGLRWVYQLDGKYENKITFANYQEKLPLFVRLCVESNIPGKYIHHAVRQICDASISSTPKRDEKAPVKAGLKGNGRFVIFPGHESMRDKVLKVAYNHLGSRANRIELDIWKQLSDITGERATYAEQIKQELTEVFSIGDQHHFVIATEAFAEGIDVYDGAAQWDKKMQDLCRKAGLSYKIRTNEGGFGKRADGKVISGDFGGVRPLPAGSGAADTAFGAQPAAPAATG